MMRVFKLLGIQSFEYKNEAVRDWGDYPEGEAIYQLAQRNNVILSQTALKEAGFKPCFEYWCRPPVAYTKKQPGD